MLLPMSLTGHTKVLFTKNHPDKSDSPNARLITQELNMARSVLKDPQQRQEYDDNRRIYFQHQEQRPLFMWIQEAREREEQREERRQQILRANQEFLQEMQERQERLSEREQRLAREVQELPELREEFHQCLREHQAETLEQGKMGSAEQNM